MENTKIPNKCAIQVPERKKSETWQKKKKIVLVSTIKNENTLSCQRKTTQIQGNNILNKETRENRIIFF